TRFLKRFRKQRRRQRRGYQRRGRRQEDSAMPGSRLAYNTTRPGGHATIPVGLLRLHRLDALLPWFRALLTHELTGKASIHSLANGTNRECKASAEERGSSQVLSEGESRITGILSWIDFISSLPLGNSWHRFSLPCPVSRPCMAISTPKQ